ncbi:MAG: hypothetical protein ACR2QB_00635 [Gammaproteobacteria bacterium]
MSDSNDLFFSPQFEAMAKEISRLAFACDIDVEQEGVGVRIIHNDDSICRRENPDAFRKLRDTMMALANLEVKALERLAPAEMKATLDEVWGAVLKMRATGKPGVSDN